MFTPFANIALSNALTAVSTPTDAFPSPGPSGRLAHPGSRWFSPLKPYGQKPQGYRKEAYDSLGAIGLEARPNYFFSQGE